MGAKNISVDDVLTDMLESIGDAEEPTADDGWISFHEMAKAAKGLTINQLREKANRMAEDGLWEKRTWSRQVYYRVKQ